MQRSIPITNHHCRPVAVPFVTALAACLLAVSPATADDTLPPIDERFADGPGDETPDFQRHVVPLFGRLGCNGRACHGSFQGQGGFQLSLFGYDFAADHGALIDNEGPRVDPKQVDESLILAKPTSNDEDEHGGGQRYKKGSWQYHVIRAWIAQGAVYDKERPDKLARLEITPGEIVFESKGEESQLKAVAVWADGTREDVTPLCRFKTNNEQVAQVDEHGKITAGSAGDTHVVAFYDYAVVPVPVMRPVSDQVGPDYPRVATPTKIDELVVAKLRKLGIAPSQPADDAMFLRRLRLDLTGTLPAPAEVERFLADTSPDKRARKIDELLESPAYAAWWTTRLCDFTGNNSDALVNVTPIRGKASEDWYQWIYKRVAENAPYDDLVAGIVLATSRNDGQSYADYCSEMSALSRNDAEGSFADREAMPHYWARREFRKPEERAIGFAYSFLGIRIQCAQCHKHPFDQWSKQDFEDFSQFFTRIVAAQNGYKDGAAEYRQMVKDLGVDKLRGGLLRKELPRLLKEGKTVPFSEVAVVPPRKRNSSKKRKPKPNQTGIPDTGQGRLLGGEPVALDELDDPREPLMEWLREKDNAYFARAFVNRVWASYFNVGIVEPADDLSLANPPSNGPLLDYLTQGFIEQGYDMKWLHREITRSRTYQLSWQPNETNRLDEVNFSRAVPRRLPAEVLYDALRQATGNDEQLQRMQSANDDRAIAIAGAGYRNQGRKGPSYALSVFGRSTRDSNCDCDRSQDPNLLQTVFLQNDADLFSMLDRRDGWIEEVARDNGLDRKSASRGKPARPKNYEQVVEQMAGRVKQLKKQGNKAGAKQAAQRLATYKNRFTAPEKQVEAAEKRSLDSGRLVRQAYLRTLSRRPTAEELARSEGYIRESDDKLAAIRDLMWSLINTKEFIVNH